MKTFGFVYHSAMEWLKSIGTDPTLTPFIVCHPYKKFLYRDRHETHMSDELCTGERWWDIQVRHKRQSVCNVNNEWTEGLTRGSYGIAHHSCKRQN